MKKIALLCVNAYQFILSPWVGNQCRYVPTCSEYTKQAIERFGVIKGGWLGLKRLSRCHPYCKKDPIDPVPEE